MAKSRLGPWPLAPGPLGTPPPHPGHFSTYFTSLLSCNSRANLETPCPRCTERRQNQLALNLSVQPFSQRQLLSLHWRYKDENDRGPVLQELPGQQGRMTMNRTFKLCALYWGGLAWSSLSPAPPLCQTGISRHPTGACTCTLIRCATTGGKGRNASLGTTAL